LGEYALAAVGHQSQDVDLHALTRRLCRIWRLPVWLSAIIGNLHLPVDIAGQLGAPAGPFRAVQLAARFLTEPASADTESEALPWSREDLDRWTAEADVAAAGVNPAIWKRPSETALLTDLLQTVLAHRQSGNAIWVERLQQEVDLLQQALDQQRAEERCRLERMKLAALAELAAGAGHEINNPLAVISGQAQYILKHLTSLENECQEDPAATAWLEQWKSKVGRSLQTIVGQTQRVHQVLTDLMQFARPAAPKVQEVPVVALVHEVTTGLATLAQDKHLRLETPHAAREWVSQADPVQVRTALHGLVRNAIEAAPPEGWVGLRLETAEPGTIDVIVEDNGQGPAASAVDHLFDPFYSGRLAGRGRGLGLSTAWRLARQNGGDVRFEGIVDGRTRFVLRLAAQETAQINYYLNGQSCPNEVNGQVQDGVAS
jgi:signal transduction histidine kinase